MTCFFLILVLLPFATQGLYLLQDLVLLQQARDFMEQALPTAYNCLDPIALADGEFRFDTINANMIIHERFLETLPTNLTGRLIWSGISFRKVKIQPEAGHWMGDNQPSYVPVITLNAIMIDHQGKNLPLSHSIELLLD